MVLLEKSVGYLQGKWERLILREFSTSQESRFAQWYTVEVPKRAMRSTILFEALIIFVTYGPYSTEAQLNGFAWSIDDPRTLFFVSRIYIFASVGFLITMLALFQKAYLQRINYELATALTLANCLVVLPFSLPYRTALLYGKNPEDVWWQQTLTSFMGDDMIMGLAFDAAFTAAFLFVPIRVRWMLIPTCSALISYAIAVIVIGSPFTNVDAVYGVVFLFALALLAFTGGRSNEISFRASFRQIEGSQIEIQEQRAELKEQSEELVNLKARNRAMRALMGTVCEVVVQAGENLCVVETSTKLDEMLGPMEGCCLAERVGDEEGRKRLLSVLQPLMSRPLKEAFTISEEDICAVLVPPVRFASGARYAQSFDAEVLVADTGQINGTGSRSWRYLVGLKSLALTEEASPPPSSESISLPLNYGSSDWSGIASAHVRIHSGKLRDCNSYFNLIFGKPMENCSLWEVLMKEDQGSLIKTKVQDVYESGTPDAVHDVWLTASTHSGNQICICATLRLCQFDDRCNTIATNSQDTSQDPFIILSIHDVHAAEVHAKSRRDGKPRSHRSRRRQQPSSSYGSYETLDIIIDDQEGVVERASSRASRTGSASSDLGSEVDPYGEDELTHHQHHRITPSYSPRETPRTTIEYILRRMAHHIVIENPPETCCHSHRALNTAFEVLLEVRDKSCESLVLSDNYETVWQCGQCLVLNNSDVECMCEVCGSVMATTTQRSDEIVPWSRRSDVIVPRNIHSL